MPSGRDVLPAFGHAEVQWALTEARHARVGHTQGIIDHAREAALANGAARVTDLFLAMTPAADFSQDSIEMYFEMLTE